MTDMLITVSENMARESVRSVLKLYEVNEQYAKLVAIISVLMREQFYGSLEIKMEGGKISICRKIENIKL